MEKYKTKYKLIKGHNNYMISDSGIVKNNVTNFIMRPSLTKDGYLRIELKNPRKKYLVHRLVVEAFIGKQPKSKERMTINHINKIKTDNNVSNLEWLSNIDNCRHGHGKRVKMITLNGELVAIFNCLKECEEETDISADYRLISAVCLGKRKSHAGYRWEYV